MTLNLPRSQAQISTRSRSPLTAPSLETQTAETTSTPGRNPSLAHSLGTLGTAEVTITTGMMDATRPSPGRPQEEAVAVATAAVAMTATDTRTAEGATGPGLLTEILMGQTDSPPTARRKATRWPESCPPSCPWWWWPWWGPGSATSSPTGGEIVSGPAIQRRSEDVPILPLVLRKTNKLSQVL